MSTATPHSCGAGGSYLNGQRREDPTRTKTARRRFAQHLRGRMDAIIYHIRKGFVENDALGLRDNGDSLLDAFASQESTFEFVSETRELAANVDINDDLTPRPNQFAFPRDADTLDAFDTWLDEVMGREVLEKYQGEKWIRKAGMRGIDHADSAMKKTGMDIPDQDVATAIRLPVHQDKLELMYTRTFTELKGINEAVAQELRRELSEGLATGANPTEIARNITERVDAVGKTRSTVLARTEVIRTHSEFSLDRMQSVGDIEEVTVKAEFTTAGDSRVCPECEALEGTVVSIDEARGVIPVHPQCRCAFLPVGGNSKAAAAASAHPKAYTALLSDGVILRTDGAVLSDLAAAEASEVPALVARQTGVPVAN